MPKKVEIRKIHKIAYLASQDKNKMNATIIVLKLLTTFCLMM